MKLTTNRVKYQFTLRQSYIFHRHDKVVLKHLSMDGHGFNPETQKPMGMMEKAIIKGLFGYKRKLFNTYFLLSAICRLINK